MPFIRYFVCAGGMLLGMLLLANRCFPVSTATLADDHLDRSVIRIHSSQRWPDAIRFDTTSAPTPTRVDGSAPISTKVPHVARLPVAEPVRQAFAMEPSLPQKPSGKIRHARHSRFASHGSRPRFANNERPELAAWPPIGW